MICKSRCQGCFFLTLAAEPMLGVPAGSGGSRRDVQHRPRQSRSQENGAPSNSEPATPMSGPNRRTSGGPWTSPIIERATPWTHTTSDLSKRELLLSCPSDTAHRQADTGDTYPTNAQLPGRGSERGITTSLIKRRTVRCLPRGWPAKMYHITQLDGRCEIKSSRNMSGHMTA